MKNIRISIFLVIIISLMFAVFFWDKEETKKETIQKAGENKLVSFKKGEVREIHFFSKPSKDDKTASAVRVKIKKDENGWNITDPVTARADERTINGLLKTLINYKFSKIVSTDPEEWGKFGLNAPEKEIKIVWGDLKAKSTTIITGAVAPVGYSVYSALVGEDKAYIGSQHLLVSTSKSLIEFRDKKIANIKESSLTRLTYFKKGDKLIDIKRRKTSFTITRPKRLKADPLEIRDFIDDLNLVQVMAFDDEGDRSLRRAFRDPLIVISWKHKDQKTKTLKLIKYENTLWGTFGRGKRAFAFKDAAESKFTKALIDFRDRRILNLDSTNLKAMTINGDDFVNIEGIWHLKSDADSTPPKEATHVRSIAVNLEFAKTDEFKSLVEAKLPGAPKHRLELVFKDKTKLKPITIDAFSIKGDETRFHVRISGVENLYRVPVSVFEGNEPGGKDKVEGIQDLDNMEDVQESKDAN